MAEIEMPGDEVQRLGELLGRVVELIDTRPSGYNPADVGPPLVRPGTDFDEAWKDGRVQVKRNSKDLKDGCDAIVKAFAEFDTGMGSSLKEGGQGTGGDPTPSGGGARPAS
ncbi:hypothetical protein ABZZ04_33550 [Streptomyces sp. NPDC006435]|uniref:hypothetical protein n=1 Tax=Streptomyces sp. NPDC006435 TaxID=3154300 RepID=UPI0033B7CE0C